MNGDTDASVYTVAFGPGGFLMIYNPKRKGWEMAGGHLRVGESELDGARREFMEEAGYELEYAPGRFVINGCTVFAAVVRGEQHPCEMEIRFCRELPEVLAFDREEYLTVIPWAEKELRAAGLFPRA